MPDQLDPRPAYPKHFLASPVPRRNTAFILMPFDASFEPVHAAIRDAAKRAEFTPLRADDIFSTRSGMEKILRGIAEAEVVIADMTGRNANVFYEAGIAHTVKDNVILLAQNLDDIPFDLRHIDHLEYAATSDGLTSLSSRLLEVIQGLPTEPATTQRPARDEAGSSSKSRLKVLHWDGRSNGPHGPGLVVHNIGEDTAEDIVGERVMPTGAYQFSQALVTLSPRERSGINPGWTDAPRPPDAPEEVPTGKYMARVAWTDSNGARHESAWTLVEKY